MARKNNLTNHPFGEFAVNTLRDLTRFGNAFLNNDSKNLVVTKSDISELLNKSNESNIKDIPQLENIIKNQEELFFKIGDFIKFIEEKDVEILSFRDAIINETNNNSELHKVNSTLSNMIIELERKNAASALEIEKYENKVNELLGIAHDYTAIESDYEKMKTENVSLNAKLKIEKEFSDRNEKSYKKKIEELNNSIEKVSLEKNLRIGELIDANEYLQSMLDVSIEGDKVNNARTDLIIKEITNVNKIITDGEYTKRYDAFFDDISQKLNELTKNTNYSEKIISTLYNVQESTKTIARDNNKILEQVTASSKNIISENNFDEKHYLDQLSDKNKTIQSLEKLIEKHTATIIDITEKEKAYEKAVSQHKILLEKGKENASALLEKVSSQEATIALLEKEVLRHQALLSEKQWNDTDIDTLKNEITRLEIDLKNANTSTKSNPELDKLIEDSLRDAEIRARDMMKEKEKVEKRHAEMLAKYEEERNTTNLEITQLHTENEYLKNSLTALAEEKICLKNRCDNLEDNLSEIRRDSEKRINEVLEEYQEAQNNLMHLKNIIEDYAEREKIFRKWGPVSVLFKNTRQPQLS